MKIFYAAEIVGKAGVWTFKQGLPLLRASHPFDFCVVAGDGTTGGAGLGRNHAAYLRKLGASCITLGDFAFFKKDLTEEISRLPYIIRPLNLNAQAPGSGSHVYRLPNGLKIAVASILGQANFGRVHGDNPHALLVQLIERLRRETPFIFIDFHAEASAEKRTLFFEAAGRCTALIGSHTRVQTTDELIRDGTAYITDAGRTGVRDSVGGVEAETAIQQYVSGVPEWTKEATGACELQGVYIDTDAEGRATFIERIKLPVA
jgi:metallophosphoesterase (TIGR00282 family)